MGFMNDSFKILRGLMLVLAAGVTGCQSPGALRALQPPHENHHETQLASSAPRTLTLSKGRVNKNGGGVTASLPQYENSPDDNSQEAPPVVPEPLTLSPKERGDQTGLTCCSQQPGIGLSPWEVFGQDRQDFFPMLARDARGLVNWHDMALLGGSLGGAIAVRQAIDDNVRDYQRDHPDRWGKASETLGILGEVQYQVPVLLGVYGYSLYSSNEELDELTKAIISAYTITGISTLTVKAITNTDRPSREWNDGHYGFPSFHTSSTFSVAAVVEEYHGLRTALPVYALGGLIGWSRIDERDHDLSDVLFGAALGYVIGKSVARGHRERESQPRLMPYSHPLEPASGLAAEWQF
jgi:hypothetical protein